MQQETWSLIIRPRKSLLSVNVAELWQYRDLLLMFIRRDLSAVYKQSVLGPLWFVIQPVLTTLIYVVIFSKAARIPTDGIPAILFYLSGITCWNYFSSCLTNTSSTFIANASVFGKVYFPRLIVPLSVVVSNLVKFAIQFLLFLAVLAYYHFSRNMPTSLSWKVLFYLPLLILLMGTLGFSAGIIISSLTTKYRDLQHLLTFGVQLLMYASPVIYPASLLSGTLKKIIMLNPLTPVIETFRAMFLGPDSALGEGLLASTLITLVLLISGMILFNRAENTFIDTV